MIARSAEGRSERGRHERNSKGIIAIRHHHDADCSRHLVSGGNYNRVWQGIRQDWRKGYHEDAGKTLGNTGGRR